MSDYEQHLLSYLDPSTLMTLSCGHVIPPSNLLAIPVAQGLSGAELDFTFEQRNSDRTVRLAYCLKTRHMINLSRCPTLDKQS